MRESNLLNHIYSHNAGLGDHVTIPPGDDMGAMVVAGVQMLATVDQLAQDVHFDLKTATLSQVGRKALTRNLSDVAAMGAVPSGAVVAACLPHGFGESKANQLFDSIQGAADEFACPLIGGDISMWDGGLILTITIFAETKGVAPVLRKGAQAGDLICVTGELGGSIETVNVDAPNTRHLDFSPRLAAGRTLAASNLIRPNCMIDLSDGLASDVSHLCCAAEKPLLARICTSNLPISVAAKQAATRDGRSAWEHALTDGEDYELCFTLPADSRNHLPATIDNVKVTIVGEMLLGADVNNEASCVRVINEDGKAVVFSQAGWEHRSE